MEVNVSMTYLNDEKFQVLNESGNKLNIDMYEKSISLNGLIRVVYLFQLIFRL